LLMRQGNDKEAEKWLREVIAMSSNHEPSRVELARLLMRQGNDKEAEKWLREVIAMSPNHEHSRVVLAKLLARHSRTSEAVELLTEFLTRNPQDTKAREVLNNIQQGRTNVFAELDFETKDGFEYEVLSEPIIQVQDENADEILPNATKPTALEQLLQELQRRADLQIEFNQADNLEKIQQNAAEGDALACFYQQWLKPDEIANPPPYAWAAQACHLYQTHASAEQWAQFNQTFPEKRLLNRFVSVQQTDNQDEFDSLSKKLLKKLDHDLDHDKESHTPLQDFMYQVLQPGHAYDKDKATFAVLASAAVDAPQFMMG